MCQKYGLAFISLIAPTSHERIACIAREANGFIYCVSSLGVTGVRSKITTDLGSMIALVKQEKKIPCAVGFGISTPEQARRVVTVADGVIVERDCEAVRPAWLWLHCAGDGLCAQHEGCYCRFIAEHLWKEWARLPFR